MYKVFQFHASSELRARINDVGWNNVRQTNPETAILMDVSFVGGSELYEPWMFKHYTQVAEVEGANDLSQVFHVGNLGSTDTVTITRTSERMHSISVGDIIQDSDGVYYMVDRYGFAEVETA